MQNTNTNPLQPPAGKVVLGRHNHTPKLAVQAWRLLVAMLEMPLRYLFGRDLFISYSRRDSRKYAPNLALALQKRMPKLSFYLDRWIAPPSGKLPLSLRLQLRWSSILIVICTERAVASPFVQDEVARFAELGRKVLTVDVDGVFSAVRGEEPWVDVSGADPEEESGAAVERGQPSENVIERILKMVEFTTQDRRLRRAVWGTLALVLISVGGIGTYGYNANKNATEAGERAAKANADADAAIVKLQQAEVKASQAETRVRDAQNKVELAEKALGVAERLRGEADRKAGEALEKERIAREESKKQENIALARRLAAENNLAVDPESPEFEKKILLTLESMIRFATREAYSNLIEGIKTVPTTPHASISHSEKVSEIAFSPVGGQMATIAGGVLWLRETGGFARGGTVGEPQELSRQRKNRTRDVAFSPDGKYLAAVDGTVVRIWLADGTRELEPIRGWRYLFSGDGRHIAIVDDRRRTANEDGSVVVVLLLDEGTTREVARVVPKGELMNISFSPDATLFSTLTEEDGKKLLNFWRTSGGTPTTPALETLALGDSVQSAGFSPNPRYIWSTNDTGELPAHTLMRANTHEVVLNNLFILRFSPDGRFLVTGTADSEFASVSGAEVWDASGERLEKRYSLREAFGGYVFSRNGKYVANSSGGESIKVWNTSSGQLVAYIKTRRPDNGGLVFTPDELFLAVSTENDVKLWPLNRDWKNSEAEHASVGVTALSSDGRFMAASSQDGDVVSVLRAADGGKVWSQRAPCPVDTVAFDWEGGRLATGGSCGLRLWDAREGQIVGTLREGDVGAVAFSRDGKYLALAREEVEVREIADPSKVVRLKPDGGQKQPMSLAFSADGVRLAAAFTDEIIIWDWRARRLVNRVYEVLSNDDFNTLRIAFDTEGKLVVADIYTAHIWDVSETPRQVGLVELQAMHTETDYKTAISTNGRFIATTFRFAAAKNRRGTKTAIWELQPTRIMANACRRLSDPLSPAEWRREFGTERPRDTCGVLGRYLQGEAQQ